MQAYDLKAGLELIGELQDHPIFAYPKLRVHISRVLARLTKGRFSTWDEFIQSVTSFREDARYGVLVNHYIGELTRKASKRFHPQSIEEWMERVLLVRSLLWTDLKPPAFLDSLDFVEELDGKDPVLKGPHGMTELEVYNFIKEVEGIDDPRVHSRILKIIHEKQPEIDCLVSDFQVDVGSLKPETVSEIKQTLHRTE